MVCEGERTEPEYIKGFERHARNATVALVVHGDRGDPKRLVQDAAARTRRAHLDAKRQRDRFLAFDETWCVFDRDEHQRFDEAVDTAKRAGLELAVSNPCVALWLLLHFRESPGPRHRRDVQRLLRDRVPDYSKGVEFQSFVQGVPDATARSRRLDEDAEAMGEAGRNPTTGFYRLTDSIARATSG